MGINSQGYVSIAELIVYTPTIISAIIVNKRHGFTRASGWIYTIILCAFRIAGAILQLFTHTDQSRGIVMAALIVESIGITPLLLSTLGMLSRFVDFVNVGQKPIIGIKIFRIIQFLIGLPSILVIVGGSSNSSSSSNGASPPTVFQIAIIIYVLAYFGIVYVFLKSFGHRSAVLPQERRIPIAVMVALPLVAVRLCWSLIAVLAHNRDFSIYNGSVGLHVAMSVVEEWLVVVDYVILGFCLQKLETDQQGEISTRKWKQGFRGRLGGRRRGGHDNYR